MYATGREEGAVFLYGLLTYNADDMIRKQAIIENLVHVGTRKTADILFKELENVTSSSKTRKYINTILNTLKELPLEHIEDGFEDLLTSNKWSYRMKRKFREILEMRQYECWDIQA